MKLRIRKDGLEEVEGLQNAYPYAYHHVDLSRTDVPWHWHEALEFDYVAHGAVKVSTAGQVRRFEKGQGFFINTNVLTAMEPDGSCILDSHLFHPVFLGGHFKSVYETKYMDPVLQNRNLELLPLGGESDTQRALLQLLRRLSALQGEPDVEFQTRNLLSEIWLLLLKELEKTHLQTTSHKNQDRLLTMMAFIQENYADRLTLEDIARAAAVSTRECLRCFRNAIHQTPTEYLMEYRVRQAAKLLEDTQRSVTDIAMETGWGSSSYFAKIFHRHYGKTPNAYRKAVTADK